MEVSGSGSQSVSLDVMKKSMQVQEQAVLKVLESTNQQSQQVAAQKTGMGNNLNITG